MWNQRKTGPLSYIDWNVSIDLLLIRSRLFFISASRHICGHENTIYGLWIVLIMWEQIWANSDLLWCCNEFHIVNTCQSKQPDTKDIKDLASQRREKLETWTLQKSAIGRWPQVSRVPFILFYFSSSFKFWWFNCKFWQYERKTSFKKKPWKFELHKLNL